MSNPKTQLRIVSSSPRALANEANPWQKVFRSPNKLALRFKPLTYAVMHFIVAILVAYALTRSWEIALGVGIVEPLVQTGAYAVHERVWAHWQSQCETGTQDASPNDVCPRNKENWREQFADGVTASPLGRSVEPERRPGSK